MKILEIYVLDLFLSSTMNKLRAEYPETYGDLDPAAFKEVVTRMIDEAESFGIEEEGNVEVYVDLCAKHGIDFGVACDWAREIFGREYETETELVEALEDAECRYHAEAERG